MATIYDNGVTVIDSRESRTCEFKRVVVEKYLEVACAFANYGDGRIIFGVTDEGKPVGLDGDLDQMCLAIENAMNDAIKPRPTFSIIPDEALRTITLEVREGESKPYLYHDWAYKRSDTATVRVDREEMRVLYLEGSNQPFDGLASAEQDLSFTELEAQLKEKLEIEDVGKDVYRSLDLYDSKRGYTNAAAILADRNRFPGVNVVRFGSSPNTIYERKDFIGVSALKQIQGPLDLLRTNYRVERVQGMQRIPKELVPEEAFREALANSITHRRWDMSANIMVYMNQDSIEIVSPGSLPANVSTEDYLFERVTECRNKTLAYVLFRLGYVELLGTGVQKIVRAYEGTRVSPTFKITDRRISITLPCIPLEKAHPLSANQEAVLNAFEGHFELTRRELEEATGLSQHTVSRALRVLVSQGYIVKVGDGRATRFALKR